MTSRTVGFPRAARLLRPAEFARVYDCRQSAAAGPLVLYAAPSGIEGGPVRLGLSVSRRVGGAVVRNRWKRRLREAFRAARGTLPVGNDFVIVVRSPRVPVGAAGAREMELAILALAARVTGRKGYAAARPMPRDDGPGRPPQRRR